jgi:regulator of replication initiation timing
MADETFTKEQLDKAVEKAVEAATGDLDGLKQKVEDLIGENKKLKTEARKAKDVDPAEVERLHSEVEDLTSKLSNAEKLAKEATKLADKAVKDLETEKGFTQKLLIADGLKSALIANGVKDEDFIDSLAAKFAPTATITVDGDKREAKIGDKSLTDAIKEWAATDAGKKFVSAPANTGGGANGGTRSGEPGKKITESELRALPVKERNAVMTTPGVTLVPDAA